MAGEACLETGVVFIYLLKRNSRSKSMEETSRPNGSPGVSPRWSEAPDELRVRYEIGVATYLALLPPSVVVRSLQIAVDLRLIHASLEGEIPAAFCNSYFVTNP